MNTITINHIYIEKENKTFELLYMANIKRFFIIIAKVLYTFFIFMLSI